MSCRPGIDVRCNLPDLLLPKPASVRFSLTRDPALVGKAVAQGLVTVAGSRRYGVVIANGIVDQPATAAPRTAMRSARPRTLALFDRASFDRRGEIDVLPADYLTETGLPAPRQRLWAHAATVTCQEMRNADQ